MCGEMIVLLPIILAVMAFLWVILMDTLHDK